jgi:redox-sensitive bicupin YhaK (pirin superfamily)/S1-C subfamily serine protease
MTERGLKDIVVPVATSDGAGVRLRRSIATETLDHLDPFFLFDHFGSEDANDYIAGFPLHPHRGIETITYMLDGSVAHRDSLGNSGVIGPGDVQWMTAGSGILHEEMPRVGPRRLDGFQIWVNLPANLKMTQPRYQDVPGSRIPEVVRPDAARIRVVAGEVDGVQGAVREIFAGPTYLDVTLPAGATVEQPTPRGHTALLYVFQGEVTVGGPATTRGGTVVGAPRLAILNDGDVVRAHAAAPARFLLLSAQPLHEPYARWGPFVMSSEVEIRETLRELRAGTFIKHRASTVASGAGPQRSCRGSACPFGGAMTWPPARCAVDARPLRFEGPVERGRERQVMKNGTWKELSDELSAIVKRAAGSVVRVEGGGRSGSGVVWSADGTIVAASHLLDDDEVAIGTPSGDEVRAEVAGRDPTTDLVVVRARSGGLSAAAWSDAPLETGQIVFSVTRPGHGPRAGLGIVSRVGDAWRTPSGGKIDRYVELDVSLHPGFSGGLVVDAEGRGVGVASAGLLRSTPLVVPPATLSRVVSSLVAHGAIRRGYLGITSMPVRVPRSFGPSAGQEVALLVTAVEEGSPAAQAGLMVGDLLLTLDGTLVEGLGDLLGALDDEQRIGHAATARIARAGTVREIAVTIGVRGAARGGGARP